MARFQYQGFAEPPSQDPLTPLTWAPTFPDRIFPCAALTAAILAGAFFFVGTAVLPAEAQITASGAHSQVFAGKQIQYQSEVGPFSAAYAPATVPTIDGWGQPTNQPPRVLQQHPAFSPSLSQPPYIPITAPAGSGIALVVYPTDIRQYQSQVAPFQAALTVVQTLDKWGQPPSQPTYRVSAHAAQEASGWVGSVSPPDIPEPRAQGVIRAELVRAIRPLLYQELAEPLFTTPTTATIEWLPTYPSQLSRLTAPMGGLTEPPSSARSLGHIGWLPVYPDRIDRTSVRAADQQAIFAPRYLPISDLRWAPSYPNQIDRVTVRAADQGFLFAPRYLPISDLRWEPEYPDQIVRPVVRVADQGAFFAPRYLPIFDLRWQASYPDRLWPAAALHASQQPLVAMVFGPVNPINDLRWAAQYPERVLRQQPAPWLGSTVFYPFPYANEPAPLLSWHPIYPNWIWRAILPVAGFPFTGPENLVPIPNPPVDGDEKHHLGTIDSLTVTSKPTIGGATGWGTS